MYKFLAKNGQLVATAEDQRNQSNIFNFGLYAVIGLTILGFVAALAFGLFQTLSNPKGAIKGIAGLALIVALFFVGQAMAGADSEGVKDALAEFNVTDGQSAIINGSIVGGIILAVLTAIAFVGGELMSFIRGMKS